MISNYLMFESIVFSDNDLYHQYDSWVNGKIDNLLVVGLSGSGKTTLSTKLLDKYKCKFIAIDDIWAKHKGDVKKKTGKKVWELTDDECADIDDKVMTDVRTILSNPGKKIIEGIHVLQLDYNILKDQAVIIKSTSYFKSFFRALKRDGVKYIKKGPWRFYDHYKHLLGMQYQIEKDLGQLRRFIKGLQK